MTIKEYKEWLNQFPEDAEVFVVMDEVFVPFEENYEFTDYSASNYIKKGHPYFGKKILFIGDV